MELCATPCQQVSKTSWLGSLACPARLTQAPHYRRSAQPVWSNRGFQHSPALLARGGKFSERNKMAGMGQRQRKSLSRTLENTLCFKRRTVCSSW
ncbi:hypothetical protein ACQKWADRAFT_76562 [Trichoderma austrokoningii]